MSLFDEQMMRLAIELGETSRQLSPPNPWVGCVITKNQVIIGLGATQKVGDFHAEKVALNAAGSKAEGATAYITLEPCCHFGRTPPCVNALIENKIAKVVIACTDPDLKVNGQGIQKLKEAGIEIVEGVLRKEAMYSLKSYLFQRENLRPYLIAKCAISLDGRIAAEDFSSKWISSEAARKDTQTLRASSQGILVGSKTAQHDLPRLTLREGYLKPLRIVFDSKGNLETKGPLFDLSLAPTLIVTTSETPPEKLAEWKKIGLQIELVEKNSKGINLLQALQILPKYGVLQLLCEGGGTLIGELLKEGLVNEFIAYIGPCLIGDKGKPMVRLDVPTLKLAPKLKFLNMQELDGTIRLHYET